MKRKVNKKNYSEADNFDRKQKRHSARREKSSKKRLSIYDEFDDEDLNDYSFSYDDFDDEDDDF